MQAMGAEQLQSVVVGGRAAAEYRAEPDGEGPRRVLGARQAHDATSVPDQILASARRVERGPLDAVIDELLPARRATQQLHGGDRIHLPSLARRAMGRPWSSTGAGWASQKSVRFPHIVSVKR